MATIDVGGIGTWLEKIEPGGRTYVRKVSVLQACSSPSKEIISKNFTKNVAWKLVSGLFVFAKN